MNEELKQILESFEGKDVYLKTSFEGIKSHILGKFRAATFDPVIYKVSWNHGEVIFPADKVTKAYPSDYTNIIEITL